MDRGEQELFAHAYEVIDRPWVICSPDKAAVRAAVALGFGDRVCSLEDLVRVVGARLRSPLRRQYTTAWLTSFRSKVLLEGL